MDENVAEVIQEIKRVRRVSDQLCTSHAALRDRYKRRALWLDIAVLLLTAWVTILGFIDPALNAYLTPPQIGPQLWIGLLGAAAFFLSLFQLKTDWKGLSEAHERSLGMYAEVKREAGYLLASGQDAISHKEFLRLASRYDMASDVGISVPEKEFLPLKRAHLLKVAISKRLDENPGAFVWVLRASILFKGNWKC